LNEKWVRAETSSRVAKDISQDGISNHGFRLQASSLRLFKAKTYEDHVAPCVLSVLDSMTAGLDET
jgi:hypothetical protein